MVCRRLNMSVSTRPSSSGFRRSVVDQFADGLIAVSSACILVKQRHEPALGNSIANCGMKQIVQETQSKSVRESEHGLQL